MAKGDKKRPKYIEAILSEVNDDLRRRKVQAHSPFPYEDPMFSFWTNYLSSKGWYRGWNVHIDRQVTFSDGSTRTVRALAGPYNSMDAETKQNYYVQIW